MSMRNQVMTMLYEAPDHAIRVGTVIEELAKATHDAGHQLEEISKTLTGLLVKGELELDAQRYLRLPT